MRARTVCCVSVHLGNFSTHPEGNRDIHHDFTDSFVCYKIVPVKT